MGTQQQDKANEYFLQALPLLKECSENAEDKVLQGLAQTSLAWMYCHGICVAKDINLAVELNQSAGDIPRALNNLGWIYNEGLYKGIDREAALRLYERCSNQGYAIGQYSLGRMYDMGEGVPVDKIKAAEWYKRAADQGNIEGLNNLAALYEEGEGVEQNSEEARRLYEIATSRGSVLAEFNLGLLYLMRKISNIDDNESDRLAEKHIKNAALAKCSQALFVMGKLSLSKNYPKCVAIKYFKQAFEHGEAAGAEQLKRMFHVTIMSEECAN